MKNALAFCFLLFSMICFGQKEKWHLEFAPVAGFLMPHHDDMLYLIDGHVVGGEINLTKRVQGDKDWHHYYLMPHWGFTFNAYSLGSEYMGNAFSGRVFFDLPIGKSRLFDIKMSFGAGWIEKPFDENENVRNSAIGSGLNASLAVEGIFNIRINDDLVFTPGIGIHHYSNGAMVMPNSGINLAMVRLGLRLETLNEPKIEDRKANFDQRESILKVGLSGGMKEIKPIGGRKYGVINFFGIWQKRVTPKSSFGAEAGVNYNESLQYRAQDDPSQSLDASNNFRFYIAGLYSLHFDPLKIRLSAGSYLAPNFDDDGMIFLRYHLVYEFGRFDAFIGLKSHYAKADNGEIGIQYRLK